MPKVILRNIYSRYFIISDNIFTKVAIMDWILYIFIGMIAITVIIVLIVVPALHFSKKTVCSIK